MVVPTHPTSGNPRSQGGDYPVSRSPRGGALVRPVDVFCCQPLGWCSPPVGVGICTKAVPERWGKVLQQSDNPHPWPGRPEVREVGATIDRCIITTTTYNHHHNIKIQPQPPHSAIWNMCLFVCVHISKCASATLPLFIPFLTLKYAADFWKMWLLRKIGEMHPLWVHYSS